MVAAVAATGARPLSIVELYAKDLSPDFKRIKVLVNKARRHRDGRAYEPRLYGHGRKHFRRFMARREALCVQLGIDSARSPVFFNTGKNTRLRDERAKLFIGRKVGEDQVTKAFAKTRALVASPEARQMRARDMRHYLANRIFDDKGTVEQAAAQLGNTPAVLWKWYADWQQGKGLDELAERSWADDEPDAAPGAPVGSIPSDYAK